MNWQILQGDALTKLKTLADESVQCVVTSPPYFGLRDYGIDGQIGLEVNVSKLVSVFSEVRRVLRGDGTCWINIADSYSSIGGGYDESGSRGVNARISAKTQSSVLKGRNRHSELPAKNLFLVPARVSLALQSDGWIVRQDIIWHKPNPMPESVRDRCTKAHEYIFLLSKSERYFFDSEAIKESVAETTKARLAQNLFAQIGSDRVPGKTNGAMKAVGGSETRNKRSVWTVTTKPFSEAHFATFPEDLIVPCILAGSSIGTTVLDPFNGAGTTGLVSTKLGRKYIGIELNPEYVEISKRRIDTGQADLFASV